MNTQAQQRRTRERARLFEAQEEARALRKVERLRDVEGRTIEAALEEVGLSMRLSTFHERLGRLREEGVRGLIDKRGASRRGKVTPELRAFVIGIRTGDPHFPTGDIPSLVQEEFKVKVSVRVVQEILKEAGLAHPSVPPRPSPKVSRPVTSGERTGAPGEDDARTQASSRTTREKPGIPEEQDSKLSAPVAEVPSATLAGVKQVGRPLKGAGLQFVAVANELTGYGREMSEVIKQAALAVPVPEPPIPVDRHGRDERGRVQSEYNAPRPRRDPRVGAQFESVEEKRREKDLTRLSLRGTRAVTIERKWLALMAFPLIAGRGRFDGGTDPRGAYLEGLGGLAYMPATLSKFARELKYLGVSMALTEKHAQLWHDQLEPCLGEDPTALILYVDNTAKPLWTHHFHQSGRVATVGRVMPCIECTLIHTGAGVPLFLRTFSGHASLLKQLLPTMEQMEQAIGQEMLSRLTVVDGEVNSVELFRQFDEATPRRLFIVPLSSTQMKDIDRVEGLGHLEEYREGDWIGEGTIKLKDSKNPKAPPYETRVIVVQHRGKDTYAGYVTNASPEEFTRFELADFYFHRWPAQEARIRDLKGGLAFGQVHGYGKSRVLNVSVIDKMTKLDGQIQRAKDQLPAAKDEAKAATQGARKVEVRQGRLERRQKTNERRLQNAERTEKTHTKAYRDAQGTSQELSRQMREADLELRVAQQEADKSNAKVQSFETTIATKKQERATLDSRREIYQTDTELDQTLSVGKLGFALLIQTVLHKFFDGLAMEINTFMNEILALEGRLIMTHQTETIQLIANPRNRPLMRKVEMACDRVNALQHKRDGRVVRFQLVWPP